MSERNMNFCRSRLAVNVSLTDRTLLFSIWTHVQWSVEKQSDTTTTAATTILSDFY